MYAIVEGQAEIQPFQPKATKVLSETGAVPRSDRPTQAGAVKLQ
jgi:hypothetical protein